MPNATPLRDSIHYQNKVYRDLLRKAGITEAMLLGKVDVYFENGMLPDCEVRLSVNTGAQALLLTLPNRKIELGGNSPRVTPFVHEVDRLRFDTGWRLHLKDKNKDPLRVFLVFKQRSDN